MSRTVIQTKMANVLGAVTGLDAAHVTFGKPENMPDQDLPIAVLRLQQPRYEPLTFGLGGVVKATYDADVNIVLGPPDMNQEDAESAQLVWADRMRNAFYADQTVAGTAWNGELYEGADNIDNYRDTGQYPQSTYRVRVEEHIVKNSSAS